MSPPRRRRTPAAPRRAPPCSGAARRERVTEGDTRKPSQTCGCIFTCTRYCTHISLHLVAGCASLCAAVQLCYCVLLCGAKGCIYRREHMFRTYVQIYTCLHKVINLATRRAGEGISSVSRQNIITIFKKIITEPHISPSTVPEFCKRIPLAATYPVTQGVRTRAFVDDPWERESNLRLPRRLLADSRTPAMRSGLTHAKLS